MKKIICFLTCLGLIFQITTCFAKTSTETASVEWTIAHQERKDAEQRLRDAQKGTTINTENGTEKLVDEQAVEDAKKDVEYWQEKEDYYASLLSDDYDFDSMWDSDDDEQTEDSLDDDRTYGDSPFNINEDITVGSQLGITYHSDNSKVATIGTDGTVTIIGAGSAIITINNNGDKETVKLKIARKQIKIDSVDLANQKTTFDGIFDYDKEEVNLDFSKISADYSNIRQGSLAGSKVVLSKIYLTGDKADNYTLSSTQYDNITVTPTANDVIKVSVNGKTSECIKGIPYHVLPVIKSKYVGSVECVFDGWYSGDELISEKNEFDLISNKNISITPKYTSVEEKEASKNILTTQDKQEALLSLLRTILYN